MSLAAKAVKASGGMPAKINADTLVSVAAILPDDASATGLFVEAIVRVLSGYYAYYELLLIDNGSPLEIQCRVQALQGRLPNIRLLRLSRRYSTEVAFAAALDHSIGDYVVLMDPLLHPPELIPRMVATAVEGSDSVTAIPAGGHDTVLDRVISRRVFGLASRILGFRLRPNESTFKIFSRRLVNSIVRIRSKNRYLSYLNASIGLNQSTISYEADLVSRKQSPLRHMFWQLSAVASILVSNSAIPLRFASLLGLMASAGNLLYLIYILVVTLVKSRIAEGWLTISLATTTMFLLLFLIMTILSEYIARILDETKEQPLYFVESESSSTVSSTNKEALNIVQEHLEPKAGAVGTR